MDETGVIREINGDLAKVLLIPQDISCCDGCKGGGICKTTEGQERFIEAINQVGGKIGDKVRITFKPLSFLGGIILVYVIPCIMLVIGAVVGKEVLSPMLPNKDAEALSAGTGFIFFMISFIVIKIFSNLTKKQSKPVITEVIE